MSGIWIVTMQKYEQCLASTELLQRTVSAKIMFALLEK